VTRVRSRDKSGTITVTLKAEAQSNNDLDFAHRIDEKFGTGWGELTIKNLNGTALHRGSYAWVSKPAESEYSDDAGSREWVFHVAELETNVGGAVR
jgi:hypothetical protein